MTTREMPLVTTRGDGMIQIETHPSYGRWFTSFWAQGEPAFEIALSVLWPGVVSNTEVDARQTHAEMVGRLDDALMARMEG